MPSRFLCLIPSDFPTSPTIVRRAARKLGPVILAETVAESRALLQYHDDIDVVVTAADLEDGDWVRVQRQIEEIGSRAELIVLTRGGGGALSMVAKARGVFGVLGEPFNAEALRNMTRQAAHRSRTACRAPAAVGGD